MKQLLIILGLFLSLESYAQKAGGGGNGGDYIRMKFMEVGNFILQNYKGGLKEIEAVAPLPSLRKTLDINVIKLSRTPLVDNGGSQVDAIGTPGSITLYEKAWYGIFQNADLVEKLVLHEMLRAVGVNDDNYVYSTLVLERYDVAQFDKEAYIRWCSESASFIESALKQGLVSKTYGDEIHIYEKALEQVEALISPKHFYFIAPSVKGAQMVKNIFKTPKNKSLYLKLALKQIATDIRYVDSKLKSKNASTGRNLGENSTYALSYIRSASQFIILAETNEIEMRILDVVFDQVYAYMVESDYARVKYASVFSELDSARNSPVLSYKRNALKYLEQLLK